MRGRGGGWYACTARTAGIEVNGEGLLAHCRGHIAARKVMLRAGLVARPSPTGSPRTRKHVVGECASGCVAPSGAAGGALDA